MDVIEYSAEQTRQIQSFSSVAARSVELAHGRGESHVYAIAIAPGGSIGADGAKHPLREGQGAFIRKGEWHAKGSEAGLLALMVQASEFST